MQGFTEGSLRMKCSIVMALSTRPPTLIVALGIIATSVCGVVGAPCSRNAWSCRINKPALVLDQETCHFDQINEFCQALLAKTSCGSKDNGAKVVSCLWLCR
jgi:hypothetical protein